MILILITLCSRDTEEAQRGWDREPVPQGFIDIMEKYVFKHFPNAKSTPPSSPLVAQRPWKTVLAGHFSGRREAYFSWLAKDQDNCYEMVVERYAKKLEMHQLHHVSLDTGPGSGPIRPTKSRIHSLNHLLLPTRRTPTSNAELSRCPPCSKSWPGMRILSIPAWKD